MRWLASRPRWALAGVFAVLLLAVLFGWVRSVPVAAGMAVVLLFLFFFGLLMALVGRRESSRPHSPH
jgi:uncharacterized membrane protein YuzA (DUF378 family)